LLDSVDHIIIAVEDISISVENYTKILGFPPTWKGVHPGQGTENALFPLENLYVELLASNGEGPGSDMIKSFIELNGEGLCGIALNTSDIEAARNKLVAEGVDIGSLIEGEGKDEDSGKIRTWKNLFLPFSLTRGLFTFLIQHKDGSIPNHKDKFDAEVTRLDHVVINTNDPEGIISLYRDIYGIRLALDQTAEQWGGRMLFFRLNKTTLEVIGKEDDRDVKDSLWGLAWVVEDLEATYDRLISEGIEITKVKKGRKPGTLVATIKSHTCNVPTLLIQHL
jgi:catechol 2,3-dioxygenase-like lactoylglutathione lyase family enzyme